jgi:DNA-binding LacI/PurR family transcriptional regulator
VCIDPLEAIPLSVPRVTAAVQDVEAMGLTAMRLLQELMAGKPPRTVLFPMQLARAGTVGPPAPRTTQRAGEK